ncbi:MAG: Outer rane receptor for ferrienterochelin and colicin [Acidobacteria bacterium]|nr:Outer rane receptor for ferrienterochelin and colicin [Acidobacteriota bacterium]
MSTSSRMTRRAVVGGLVLLCLPAASRAQDAAQLRPVTHVASIAAGSIQGTVQDEQGAPIAGATISALGASSAFAVSDRSGRFEMRTLSPGPYLLRAHLSGFVASRGQVVDVRPSARASSSIALRHVSAANAPASYPVLAAGVAAPADAPAPAPTADPNGAAATAATGNDDHGELAWRLRHARRTILKDATVPEEMVAAADAPSDGGFNGHNVFGRVTNSSARLASNFFAGTPFSGQVNLLTTGSFDTPQQLFSQDNFAHNTAYLALGAPVGEHADWTVRAALTQGDIASWIVAGEYTTRAPARHRYDIGLSYSTQRYEGGNVLALRDVTDGSRNAGAIYAFDTFSITPILTLTYGGRYARYDYLDAGSLVSPRVALTYEPAEHFRVSTMMSSRAVAPGAEEFMPRLDSGILLPPQRTFSSIAAGRPFEAERTNHVEVEVERDIASTTVSLRAYRQHVSEQIVTLFGVNAQDAPAAVGHYLLGNVGDVDASGLSAGIRTAIAGRIHAAVEYSVTRARVATPDLGYMVLLDPAALRLDRDHIHDLSTSIETEVPETATRVIVLYRVSNAFARAATPQTPAQSIDARFDVQVRQSLPFMDFSNAKWEMLVAVRNFFRETASDQSIYDELLVVRPPKRIVGGLTLKF